MLRTARGNNSETDVLVKKYGDTEKLHCPLLHKGGTWPARKRKRQIDFSALGIPLLPKKYLEML